MEEKIIKQIGLLGEKFGAITAIAKNTEASKQLKDMLLEIGKEYERQKIFLEEILKWHIRRNIDTIKPKKNEKTN